jgi:hypothetical protein
MYSQSKILDLFIEDEPLHSYILCMLLVKINCDVAKGRPVQRETVMLNKTAVF